MYSPISIYLKRQHQNTIVQKHSFTQQDPALCITPLASHFSHPIEKKYISTNKRKVSTALSHQGRKPFPPIRTQKKPGTPTPTNAFPMVYLFPCMFPTSNTVTQIPIHMVPRTPRLAEAKMTLAKINNKRERK